MSEECYPMEVLPGLSRLFRDYLACSDESGVPRPWYGAAPGTTGWMGWEVGVAEPGALADALLAAEPARHFGPEAKRNVGRLRDGARAVVTGQQVGLFGGPLLTLLKAATAIARAAEAERVTGIAHVPVFWLASEDHDLAEVNQLTLAGKAALETVRLTGLDAVGEAPVGAIALPGQVGEALEQVSGLLGYAPVSELLGECYGRPGATLASAFAEWMTRLFARHGLVVIDAAGREFHRLGASTLRAAIERAPELEQALLSRTAELEQLGYHAQVLVKSGASLLFLLDGGRRVALRRTADGWKAGPRSLAAADLLEILEREPERISPNALLRPVFQDTILPVAAYVGGPAEIAYFAQSEVLYRAILGRVTPVLPRLSATVIEPAIGTVMARHEVSLRDVIEAGHAEALALRLGARAMPIEAKRRVAATGNALDAELTALTDYLGVMDAGLGRAAGVAGNKMRYQMNRLRRMASRFQLERETSLARHAQAMTVHLYPGGHAQERVLGGVEFLASAGVELVDRLVTEAAAMCRGHVIIRLQT